MGSTKNKICWQLPCVKHVLLVNTQQQKQTLVVLVRLANFKNCQSQLNTHANFVQKEAQRQIQPLHATVASKAPIKNSMNQLHTLVKRVRRDKRHYLPQKYVKFAPKDCTKNYQPPQHTIASRVRRVLLPTVDPSFVRHAFPANTNICLKQQRTNVRHA